MKKNIFQNFGNLLSFKKVRNTKPTMIFNILFTLLFADFDLLTSKKFANQLTTNSISYTPT